MTPSIDTFHPSSPTGHAVAAAVLGSVGFVAVFTLLAHLFAIQFEILEPGALLLTIATAIAFTTAAYREAATVVRHAERSVGTNAVEQSQSDEAPVDVLQRRYADGDISTEEFEERVERLVEQDEPSVESTLDADRELDRA